MGKIFLISLFICTYVACFGQENIYSQPFLSGILMNPALIGNANVQTRIGGVYRTQWKVENVPYENYGLFFESKVNELKYGLLLNQSKTGDIGFKKTSILLASGLSKKLGGGNNILSFGAQFGIYQMNINYLKLQFDNQYNPSLGYDPTLETGEEFEATTLIQPDINIGLNYDFELHTKMKIEGQIGFSIIHINTPGRIFNKEDVVLPMHTIFHAKLFFHLNKYWGIEPLLIYSKQDLNQELRLGMNTAFQLVDDNKLRLGIANDLAGRFTFLAQFEMEKFAIGTSIDANISKLNQSVSDNNTFELTLLYNLPKKSTKTYSKDLLR